jgi:SAM-dependent methyltransferase
MRLDALYRTRFGEGEEAWKRVVWRILWRRVFQRMIRPQDVYLDIGSGYCELANLVVARRRIVVDLNQDTLGRAAPGLEVHLCSAERMDFLANGSVDVVFSSNFFEHLPDKSTLVRVVEEIRRVLRPGGSLIVMGPNVRLMPGSYWDYFDHNIALSERSLVELLAMSGFAPSRVTARFLPSSTRSVLPRWAWLVHGYLILRPLSSFLLGRQFLVVASHADEAPQ